MADRARHHAGHPLKVQPQNPDRARPADLPPAKRRRTYVLPVQGLAPRRHQVRPQHKHLHGNHRHSSLRHMVALMSPDPRSRLREAPNGTAFPAIVEIQDGKLKFVRFSLPEEKITDAIYRIYHQCEHLIIAEKVTDESLAACKVPVEINADKLGV